MTERSVVTLVCDGCGREGEGVETEKIGDTEGELCRKCLGYFTKEPVVHFFKNARSLHSPVNRAPIVRRRNGKARDMSDIVRGMPVVKWPDTPWRFTFHALERMGQRLIDPVEDVLPLLKKPELTIPGDKPDTQVWFRNDVKAVVHPEQAAVLTVARRDET